MFTAREHVLGLSSIQLSHHVDIIDAITLWIVKGEKDAGEGDADATYPTQLMNSRRILVHGQCEGPSGNGPNEGVAMNADQVPGSGDSTGQRSELPLDDLS